MSRIAGIFIIIAILFSYLPMDMGAMGNCPDEEHHTNTRVDCGYAFHCPAIDGPIAPQLSVLSINGWLKSPPKLLKFEELPRSIFHPPKNILNHNRKG